MKLPDLWLQFLFGSVKIKLQIGEILSLPGIKRFPAGTQPRVKTTREQEYPGIRFHHFWMQAPVR